MEQLQAASPEVEIAQRLDAIENSLSRIEAALSPIVDFFEKIKEHPMLRGMLG